MWYNPYMTSSRAWCRKFCLGRYQYDTRKCSYCSCQAISTAPCLSTILRVPFRPGLSSSGSCLTWTRLSIFMRKCSHYDCQAILMVVSLDNLTTAVQTRFEQLDDFLDLDQAIKLHKETLTLRPLGHSNCSASLNNLAIVAIARLEQSGTCSTWTRPSNF